MNKPARSIGQRLLHNTLFNLVGRLWVIGGNLLLTPLILSYLGQDRFAIWTLFWSLTFYFFLLDLGLGPSLVKHLAQFQANGEPDSINRAVTTIFCLYLGASLVLLVVLWPAMEWLAARLSLPEGLLPEATLTFRAGLVVLLIMNLITPFDAVLKGFQRMDLTNLTLMLVSIPNVLGSYVVLRQGWGLQGLVMIAGAVFLLQLLLLVGFAKQTFPALAFKWRHLDGAVVGTLLRYGSRLQIPRLADLISSQADKILLGLFLPIRYVTFYDLGAKVSTVLHDLPNVLVGAVLPAASELAGREDHRRLWLLYERGTKYLLLVSLPILVGIWLTAHLILQIWLGHVSTDVHRAVLFLSTGYWATISVGMVTTLGAGLGWVGPLMRVGLFQSALNLGLSLVLILSFGFIGALIGTMVALLVSNAYMLVLFCRDFDRSLMVHVYVLLQMMLVNALPTVLSAGYLLWVSTWLPEGERGVALVAFLGCVGLYVMAYLGSIRWSGILDQVDYELLGGYVPLMRSLVRMPS